MSQPKSASAKAFLNNVYEMKESWDQLSFPVKSTLVDTDEKLAEFMKVVQAVKQHDVELFCDCEGNNLGRFGTLSLLQIMFASLDHTWVIDITILKTKAFDTRAPGPNGRTLREILEDESIFKVFYDTRNDSDALFSTMESVCGVSSTCSCWNWRLGRSNDAVATAFRDAWQMQQTKLCRGQRLQYGNITRTMASASARALANGRSSMSALCGQCSFAML